jgi:hypothetical protein
MTEDGSERESTPTAQDKAFESSSLSEIPEILRPYMFDDFIHGYTLNLPNGWEVVHLITNKTQKYPNNCMIIFSPPYKDRMIPTFQIFVYQDMPQEERVIYKNTFQDHDLNKMEIIGLLMNSSDDSWTILPSDQNPNDQRP